MTEKNNKKLFLILTIVSAVIVVIFLVMISSKVKVEEYFKYSSTITVMSVKNNEQKHNTINIYNDGTNSSIQTSFVNNKFYYLSDHLVTLDYNSSLIKRFYTDKNYKNIYKIIMKLNDTNLLREIKSVKSYTVFYSAKEINQILSNLYIPYETKEGFQAEVSIKDKKINRFELNLKNVGVYDQLGIIINYSELEDDYIIDTSIVSSDESNYVIAEDGKGFTEKSDILDYFEEINLDNNPLELN